MEIVSRGTEGLKVTLISDQGVKCVAKDESNNVRVACYSVAGSHLAYCNGTALIIRNLQTKAVVEVALPRVSKLLFSPSGRFLLTWEPLALRKGEDPNTVTNQHVILTETGEIVTSYVEKDMSKWEFQWTRDERLMMRMRTSEIMFYENGDLDRWTNRLTMKDANKAQLAQCSSSNNNQSQTDVDAATAAPETSNYNVAVFTPVSKSGGGGGGGMSTNNVRIFAYPRVGAVNMATSNKTLGTVKLDEVGLEWNCAGTALLVHTRTESSTTSYYGDQHLHLMGAANCDQNCSVLMSKPGPIHHIAWHPTQPDTFLVTYGNMPSRTSVFNLKCEIVANIGGEEVGSGGGAKNACYFNPQGTLLCLAGFGSVRSNVDIWDWQRRKLLTSLNVGGDDVNAIAWAADGQHLTTATTAPRLRINNCYRVWHYTGRQIYTEVAEQNAARPDSTLRELWQVMWRPQLPPPPTPAALSQGVPPTSNAATQPLFALVTQQNNQQNRHAAPHEAATSQSSQHQQQEQQQQHSQSGGRGGGGARPAGKYVPPSLRNRTAVVGTGAQVVSLSVAAQQPATPMSAQALKNKKKRDNKKKQRENEAAATAGEGDADDATPHKAAQKQDVQQQRPMETQQQNATTNASANSASTNLPNRIRNIKKRLNQIEGLKEARAAGTSLEDTQITKIESENQLREELENLMLSVEGGAA